MVRPSDLPAPKFNKTYAVIAGSKRARRGWARSPDTVHSRVLMDLSRVVGQELHGSTGGWNLSVYGPEWGHYTDRLRPMPFLGMIRWKSST